MISVLLLDIGRCVVVGLFGAPAFSIGCSVYVACVCCSYVLLACVARVYCLRVLLTCVAHICRSGLPLALLCHRSWLGIKSSPFFLTLMVFAASSAPVVGAIDLLMQCCP